MLQFTGHLHPVLVHLPIGLLLLACFFQLISLFKKYAYLQPTIGMILFWGMLSAIASCITGYLLANSGDYDEELVGRHQWFGISVAAVSLTYYSLYRYRLVQKYTWVLPVLLLLLISITGHLGGSLTHGSDYLTGSFTAITDTVVVKKPLPDVQEAVAYTDIVQPILQSKCNSCHGPNKQKGKLRLDQPDGLTKGGKDGLVITAGRAEESELIKRVLLEKADDHHMPPKEKPQLTEKEIALLHWWIASGASFTKKTKELTQEEKIKPVLVSLQSGAIVKDKTVDVPVAPIEKARETDIKKLQALGVVVIPVALNSNYLSVNFVSVPAAADRDMALLLPLKKQLVSLRLSFTQITDTAMSIIVQCTNLRRLQLDSTGITDKGLATAAALTQLQSLNLVNTKVTATGLLRLKQLNALQSVYVYQTGSKGMEWMKVKKYFPKLQIDTGGYVVPLFADDTTLVKPPKRVTPN